MSASEGEELPDPNPRMTSADAVPAHSAASTSQAPPAWPCRRRFGGMAWAKSFIFSSMYNTIFVFLVLGGREGETDAPMHRKEPKHPCHKKRRRGASSR